MNKNSITLNNIWRPTNCYVPVFELLRNDCTLSVEVVTNTGVNYNGNLVIGYDSLDSARSVAKMSIIIRGTNDYKSNLVDKVPYSLNNKLTLDDFELFTDTYSSNLFGLKSYNGHIYFCSYVTDRKAKFTINVLSYDNPKYAEEGHSCEAYRVCNQLKDYSAVTQYWQSLDKKPVYTQIDRGFERKVILPSNKALRFTLKYQAWSRFHITATGSGMDKTVNETISVFQTEDDIEFKYYDSCNDGKLYKDNSDVKVFYLTWGDTNYNLTLVDVYGVDISQLKVDIISKEELASIDKTEITSRETRGSQLPAWRQRPYGAGYYFFGVAPVKMAFWDGAKFRSADGADATAQRSGFFRMKPSSSDIYVGFRFFCTDRIIDMNSESDTYLQVITAPVGEGGIDIIYKGQDTTDPDNPVDVWVDALGRVIS